MIQHNNKYCCNAKVLDDKQGCVCEACEAQGICACYDPDSSDKAWEYYKHVYENVNNTPLSDYFSKICQDKRHNKKDDCLSFLTDSSPKRLKPLQKDDIPKEDELPIMGADTMFNFNHGKYNSFIKVSGIDTNQLDRCAKNHHSLLNFSLMPQTGAMNNFKNVHCQSDRFDVFINELANFYNSKDQTSPLENYEYRDSTGELKTIRNNFLNTFSGVEDYCKQVYFIDEDFLTKLVSDSDEKSITKTLKDYMTLAEDYWEMRHKQLKGVINDNSEKCDPEKCAGHTYTIKAKVKGKEKEIQYFYMPKECPQNNQEIANDD